MVFIVGKSKHRRHARQPECGESLNTKALYGRRLLRRLSTTFRNASGPDFFKIHTPQLGRPSTNQCNLMQCIRIQTRRSAETNYTFVTDSAEIKVL